MNTLSQFLYAADVLSSVSVFLGFVAFFMAIGMGIVSGTSISALAEEEEFPHKLNYLWLIVLLTSIGAVAIPSKDTMYAIAASEMGEEVYKSKIGQKSLAAVEKWIDKQLEEGEAK